MYQHITGEITLSDLKRSAIRYKIHDADYRTWGLGHTTLAPQVADITCDILGKICKWRSSRVHIVLWTLIILLPRPSINALCILVKVLVERNHPGCTGDITLIMRTKLIPTTLLLRIAQDTSPWCKAHWYQPVTLFSPSRLLRSTALALGKVTKKKEINESSRPSNIVSTDLFRKFFS